MQEAQKTKKGLKGYYMTTFLIGLGFFTMGLMDPLYDNYVPIFLGRFVASKAVIGTIMTLDNVLAIFLIPIFSALSDRTRTRIGRRMPFIIVCLPMTAILFGIIPFSALTSIWFLIIMLFFLNLFKQAARGPVVALMPDIIPGDLRSEANGVINTMGGIATIVGTVGLAQLMNIYLDLPGLGKTNEILAFPVASILVIIATILLFFFVKEDKRKYDQPLDKEEKQPIFKSIKFIFTEKNKSAMFILLSLLFWFIGYQGALPWLGMYSMTVLQTSPGTAALATGCVGIAYAIFAIPSGIVAHKHGRKKTIRISLICIVAIMLIISVLGPMTASLAVFARQIIFWALLFCFGIFWVSVVTNSFPMLWQMADYSTMGIYTGLYYFFSQLASIISPPITGAIIDKFNYTGLFIFVAASMLIAFLLMSKVNRGEPDQDPLPLTGANA